MIKFKQFNVGDSGYEEQMEKFQIEYPQAEFLQITGGHMSPEQIWFKYDDGAELPKLSIPKKIADELEEELKNSEDKLYTFNKCYEDMTLPYKLLLHKNYDIICAYLNPLTRPFVEVEDE